MKVESHKKIGKEGRGCCRIRGRRRKCRKKKKGDTKLYFSVQPDFEKRGENNNSLLAIWA